MSDNLARAVGGVLLVGMLVNSWFLWDLSSQMGKLQTRLDNLDIIELPVRPAPSVTRFDAEVRPGGRQFEGDAKRKGRKLRRKSKGELTEAEKLARLEDRFDNAESVVSAFGQQEGLSADTQATVLEELQLMHEAVLAIREDVRAKAISQPEGRKEARQLREDSDARLTDVLNKAQVAALREMLASERE